MLLRFNTFISLVFCVTGCFQGAFAADPSTTCSWDELPTERLWDVLVYAYPDDYDDPSELNSLKTVSKQWNTIITDPKFLPACKQHGWEEPVIIFCQINPYFVEYCLEHGIALPKTYKKRGKTALYNFSKHPDYDPDNTICFQYITNIYDSNKHPAIFTSLADATYLGIWVNPKKTMVHTMAVPTTEMLNHWEEGNPVLSKLPLHDYIPWLQERQKCKSEELPTFYKIHTSYTDGIYFQTPIPASRIIKKKTQKVYECHPHVKKAECHYMNQLVGTGIGGMIMGHTIGMMVGDISARNYQRLLAKNDDTD